MEHKIMQEEWCLCWVFKKNFENWKKKNEEEEEETWFFFVNCFVLGWFLSHHLLLNDHATFHDLNIIWNKETYFVDTFFCCHTFFEHVVEYVVLYRPWICYGVVDQVRKKLHFFYITKCFQIIHYCGPFQLEKMLFYRNVRWLDQDCLKWRECNFFFRSAPTSYIVDCTLFICTKHYGF